VPFLVPVIVQR
jgi:hypothetical protein